MRQRLKHQTCARTGADVHRPAVVRAGLFWAGWHVFHGGQWRRRFDTHAEAIAHADRIARLRDPDYRAVPNEEGA